MKKILIIDDSRFFRGQMRLTLSGEYEVVEAENGEDGLEAVKREKPDLVLLDGVLPDMSGYDVCEVLRDHESNNLMPIIMISSNDDREDVLRGLELGADDYIIKPFDNRELFSRTRNLLRRIDRNRNANPLTGLRGNIEIQRDLMSRISRERKFAVAYVDIDNFKAYNDVYGFSRGDTIIVLTADILRDQVAAFGNGEHGDEDDFVGHIGGDDFIFISTPDKIETLCREVISEFDEKVKAFYNQEDIGKGCITTMNRKGKRETFPIMTVSIAVVTNTHRNPQSYVEIGDIAAEIKKKLKAMSGSNYYVDRRTGPERVAEENRTNATRRGAG